MDEIEREFALHPQLAADTISLGSFPLCQLLLMNDSHYPWFIMVPKRADITEIYHLTADEQQQLMRESSYLSQALADLFHARKMNVATLGNMVPQLHIHHVVRQEDDAAWPGPVWGTVAPTPYTDEQLSQIREKVLAFFGEGQPFEVPA